MHKNCTVVNIQGCQNLHLFNFCFSSVFFPLFCCSATILTKTCCRYPMYGGMQDWNYIHAGCFELTLEISDNKWPNASESSNCVICLAMYPSSFLLFGSTTK
ncbi:hypothetical protein Peur_010202 [Populus x canadensis]